MWWWTLDPSSPGEFAVICSWLQVVFGLWLITGSRLLDSGQQVPQELVHGSRKWLEWWNFNPVLGVRVGAACNRDLDDPATSSSMTTATFKVQGSWISRHVTHRTGLAVLKFDLLVWWHWGPSCLSSNELAKGKNACHECSYIRFPRCLLRYFDSKPWFPASCSASLPSHVMFILELAPRIRRVETRKNAAKSTESFLLWFSGHVQLVKIVPDLRQNFLRPPCCDLVSIMFTQWRTGLECGRRWLKARLQ